MRAPSAPATAPGRTVAQTMSDLALAHGVMAEKKFEHALQGGVIQATEGRARALARDPRVAWVEEDREIEMYATSNATWSWWIDRIDERDLPLNNHFTYNRTGYGGEPLHHRHRRQFQLRTMGGALLDAYSTVRDGSGNMVFGDPVGHGTNVAIHAASTVAGIANGSKVRAVRVTSFTCGSSGWHPGVSRLCRDLFLSVRSRRSDQLGRGNRITPAVANLSLGGSISTTLETAVRGMVNAKVTTVAAAGNSSASACNVSPARMTEVITVALPPRPTLGRRSATMAPV